MRQNHDSAYRKQLGLDVRGKFDETNDIEFVYIEKFEDIEEMGIDKFLEEHGRKNSFRTRKFVHPIEFPDSRHSFLPFFLLQKLIWSLEAHPASTFLLSMHKGKAPKEKVETYISGSVGWFNK